MANGTADELIGQRFGRLIVVADSGLRTRANNRLWYCRCDCGQLTTVSRGNLEYGKTRSCGCLRRERLATRNRARAGSDRTPERIAWDRLLRHGDLVHPIWRQEFLAFVRDVGLPPTSAHYLERIDAQGLFAPGNVRWAIAHATARRSAKTVLTIDGVTKTIGEWAASAGLPVARLLARLRRGIEPRKAVLAETRVAIEPVGGALTFQALVRSVGNAGRCVSVPAAAMRGLRDVGWTRKLIEVSIDRCAPFRARVSSGARGAHRLYLPRDATHKLRLGQRVTVALRA